jgi:hypothetical protein
VIGNSLGELARADNWSISGNLARLGLNGTALTVCWVAASGVVLGFALWRARDHFRHGQMLEATLTMGIAAALVTSVTWPHHVLFLVVASALLAVQRPAVGVPVLIAVTVVGYLTPVAISFCILPIMVGFVVAGPRFWVTRRRTGQVLVPTSSRGDDPAGSVCRQTTGAGS